MSPTLQELKAAASALPASERAELVQFLLHSLNEQEGRAQWLALAEQRMAEVRAGQVVGIPAEEVLKEQPVRVRLRELPTPPEVAAEAERWVKQYGRPGKNGRRDAEDRLKLQYYYGGQSVYTVRTAEGLMVVPIPEQYQGTPDLRHILLTADERASACLEVPPPWSDDVSEILT